MAKNYVGSTGLQHIWSKCLNLFAKQTEVDGIKTNLTNNYSTTSAIDTKISAIIDEMAAELSKL